MKMQCPIGNQYLNEGYYCILNQLFDENALNYSKGFHGGLDFRTKGQFVWNRGGKRSERKSEYEKNGRIPVFACFSGRLYLTLHEDKERKGWGLSLKGKEIDGRQYKALYWHIETPWASLRGFRGFVDTIINLFRLFNGREVKAGQIVAIAGDNGFSTGPHLHFELRVRERKEDGRWGNWELIDPIYKFTDEDVLYVRANVMQNQYNRYFYKGEEISKNKAQTLQKKLKSLYIK